MQKHICMNIKKKKFFNLFSVRLLQKRKKYRFAVIENSREQSIFENSRGIILCNHFQIELPFEAATYYNRRQKLVREEIEKTWHPRWSISYRCDLGLGKVALVRFESDQLTAFSLPHFFLPPLRLSSPTLRPKPPQRSSRRSSVLPRPIHPSFLVPLPISSFFLSTFPSRRSPLLGGRFHGRLTLVACIASTNGQLFFGISMLSQRDPGNVLDLVTDNSSPVSQLFMALIYGSGRRNLGDGISSVVSI